MAVLWFFKMPKKLSFARKFSITKFLLKLFSMLRICLSETNLWRDQTIPYHYPKMRSLNSIHSAFLTLSLSSFHINLHLFVDIQCNEGNIAVLALSETEVNHPNIYLRLWFSASINECYQTRWQFVWWTECSCLLGRSLSPFFSSLCLTSKWPRCH